MARATMNTVIKNKSAKPNKTGAKGGKKKASFNKQLHDNKGQIFIGLAALVIIFIIFQNYQLELQKKTTTNNRGKSIPVVAIVEGVINSGDKKAREPKAMIVGAKSCGTSALQNYLSLHPYVALTAVKETHYYDKNLHRGEYWYKNEFSLTTPEQSGVDRTDTYLTSSRDVASRVYERNPTAKIIVMVCDPVIRAYLDYYNIYNGIKEMSVKRNLTMKGATTFSRYVDKYMEYIETVEEDPSTINFEKFEDIVFKIDDIMPEASIITNGLYYFHVQRWFRHFDRSQVLILDADTLTATPWDVMIDLQNFLELPDLIGEQNFYQNTTLGVYCLRSEKGYKCPEPNSIASLGSIRHYSISGRDQRRLKEFYENYTDMFYQLIGTGEEKEEAEQQV